MTNYNEHATFWEDFLENRIFIITFADVFQMAYTKPLESDP
jgi:hypothetical protein